MAFGDELDTLDPRDWRAWTASQFADGHDCGEMWAALTKAASAQPVVNRDGDLVGYRMDAALQKLWWNLRLGPKGRVPTEIVCGIDPSELRSLSDCIGVYAKVLAERFKGALTDQEVEVVIRVVDSAVRAHQANATNKLVEDLSQAGGRIRFESAAETKEERYASFKRFLESEEADGDDS